MITEKLKTIELIYHSNYPFNTETFNKKLKKPNNLKKITIKSYLLFLCIVSKLVRDNALKKSAYFRISLDKKKILTILKAPFRHKLAKKHLFIKRYKLSLTLKFNFELQPKNNKLELKHHQLNLDYLSTLETNVTTQHKIKSVKHLIFEKKQLRLN